VSAAEIIIQAAAIAGLIHRMNFRVCNGRIEFQVFRDDPNTRRARKMCRFER
jgi:hypothetical protein